MLKTVLILTIFIYTAYAQAACVNYRKIYGLVNLKDKKWETTHINKNPTEICGEIPAHPSPNLEIHLVKDQKEFKIKIYRPLADFWDIAADEGKLKGGRLEIKHLFIDAFYPEWYKGAKLTLRSLSDQKVIVEATL